MPFDKSKFIDRFKTETREHLTALNLGLLKLEKKPGDTGLLEAMMREAHTIKGSATMMGFKRIADIAHHMEDGLEKAMKGQLKLGKDHFDVLFTSVDAIEPLLEDKVTWEDKGVQRPVVETLIEQAAAVFSGKELPKPVQKKTAPERKKKTPPPAEEQKEEETTSTQKETVHPEAPEGLQEACQDVFEMTKTIDGSIRVDTAKLDKLMNLSGELLISKIRLHEIATNISHKIEGNKERHDSLIPLVNDLTKVDETIDLLTSDMQDEVMNARMIPVAMLFNTFPRAMRDLANEKGKAIDFDIHGEDTHLDKTIIDEMQDPLLHLLRNAVDHGIETPDERVKTGKNPTGKISLSAYQQGSQVLIEISDDGHGIDLERVKEQAVAKGIVAKERVKDMVDEQIYQLLFTPGFSTKDNVTDVSGRGVGLDVVREKVAKLKGIIEVSSDETKGTRFIMKLPLTLAITESLIVTAGKDIFAIPIDAVVETVRISPDDIKTVERKEAITIRGHILPLVRLRDIFGLPKKGIFEKRYFPVVIAQSVEKRIGILVDQLLGRQEIIGKNLGDPLKNVTNIAGATILGDGRVLLILDIPSIIESSEGVIIRKTVMQDGPTEKKHKTILLAEDVMSTAMLQKNILESVGYAVVLAKDGQEALEKAGQEKFNLIITDVLMPRMDGFELTSHLKKDKLHKNTPVIIVTTRESDEDKRRGMEAGADAYILKSEFTSETLLETIERLIG